MSFAPKPPVFMFKQKRKRKIDANKIVIEV
jgi:hypothetical protein